MPLPSIESLRALADRLEAENREFVREHPSVKYGENAVKPTINLTNFSSRKLHHGHVYSIMARPRAWEHGEGSVSDLVPNASWLCEVQRGACTMAQYRAAFEERLERSIAAGDLAPGFLKADGRRSFRVVEDGDTLCCACSVIAAKIERCHRAWAAPFLVRAGWCVILDGVEVERLNP